MSKWIITTSGNRKLNDVTRELTQAGFAVEQIHSEIGSVAGDASADVAEKLRSIPGVADVSPDTPVDIGPPDSPVTW
jgi:hypothetical protein